eukprot:364216-Chlamydomonas_euryale.AAC.5
MQRCARERAGTHTPRMGAAHGAKAATSGRMQSTGRVCCCMLCQRMGHRHRTKTLYARRRTGYVAVGA